MTSHRAVRGFTLIEILVSVALFSIVMVMALGSLLSMSVAIRKAEGINAAVNNLGAAIDSVSRALRTGTRYHCGQTGTLTNPQDCMASPQSYLTFKAFGGTQVTYCLSGQGSNVCNVNSSVLTCTGGSGTCQVLRQIGAGAFTPMTSPEVNITYLAFYVEGSPLNDNLQPKVTTVVAGSVQVTASQSSNFNIQTAVTQRMFDE